MELRVTVSITPYDIAVIVVIYLHCIQGAKVPLEVFQNLISPTLESSDFNPLLDRNIRYEGIHQPLIPNLCNIIGSISRYDNLEDFIVKFIKLLTSIEDLESVYSLLKVINSNCLVKTSTDLRIVSKKNPKSTIKYFTESSFIGQYIVICLMKKELGDFEERDILLKCFRKFVFDFKNSEVYKNYEPKLQHINYVLDVPTSNENDIQEDQDMINTFKKLSSLTQLDKKPDLLIMSKHLESILDWYLYKLIKDDRIIQDDYNDDAINLANKIMNNISLHNETLFPTLHIIKYFKYLKTNSYQEALDCLHNYFDYMLSQNSDPYFHISLLCLATFHTHFHDYEIAIKCFDEATKVAREHKDTDTLNLIIVWIINFIEENPEHATKFQIKVNQIVKFLKSCSDSVNANVFENAYRFESLFLLRGNDDYISTLEASFKYLVISLQQHNSERSLSSLFSFWETLWRELGFPSIANAYSSFSKTDSIQQEIEETKHKFELKNFNYVKNYLEYIELESLKYNQKMDMYLLQVQYERYTGNIDMALKTVGKRIFDCTSLYSDFRMKFEFEIEKCNLFLASGVGYRSLPLLTKLLNHSHITKNGVAAVKLILILSRILLQIGKTSEANDLIKQNLANMLQFSSYRYSTISLLNNLNE